VRTYRSFIRHTIIFAAHVAAILALMAYFLTG
jgi:Bacterial aa3 type cytochrome c oxidase subunit IV